MRLAAALAIVALASFAQGADRPTTRAIVEIEEDVYRYDDPANGSGPFWCAGNSCIVRVGEHVLVSGTETIADAKPLNNVRWMLLSRTAAGWQVRQKDPTGRTREPCPLVCFPDGNVFLSANPTLAALDAYSGPAQPQILRFPADNPQQPPQTILPEWDGKPAFTEHSYRTFVADGPRREMILFQNIGYTRTEWAFRDAAGQWSAQGRLAWPWGADYAKPQAIRLGYPAVQLRNRAVYFMGVSDIVEPNVAWRDYKRQLTKREWDYDFRRLFFTWTPDITEEPFRPWVEVASREKTAGWIFPCDLYTDAAGTVHLLWTERAIDTRLRDKFFPGERQDEALNYATIRDGAVTSRKAILRAEEGDGFTPLPGRAQFHMAADGRLFIFSHVLARNSNGGRSGENRLMQLLPGGELGPVIPVPLKKPVGTFFTNSVRAGCEPSDALDVLGDAAGEVRYARIRLGRRGN